MSSLRARSSASGPQGYQSTGLWACWSRYGLVSFARRLGMRPVSHSVPAFDLATGSACADTHRDAMPIGTRAGADGACTTIPRPQFAWNGRRGHRLPGSRRGPTGSRLLPGLDLQPRAQLGATRSLRGSFDGLARSRRLIVVDPTRDGRGGARRAGRCGAARDDHGRHGRRSSTLSASSARAILAAQ